MPFAPPPHPTNSPTKRSGWRAFRRQVLVLAGVAGLLAGCDMPKDPRQTAEHVENGVMRVGVADNSPWARMSRGEATGLEAELARRIAQALHARIEWVPGGESNLMHQLEEFQLDLLIGGLRDDSPWTKRVGLTRPYLESEVVVGAASGVPIPDRLEGIKVAVVQGDPVIAKLWDKKARVVTVDRLDARQGLVACEDWQVSALGLHATGIHLDRVKHVLAVPPGENRWILRIERILLPERDALRAQLARSPVREPGGRL